MKIFVYGTLLAGHGNHPLIEGSKYLGKAVTPPEYTMISLGGFPGVSHAGITAIQGELYEVNSKTLARLDGLEGHPTFYQRTPIEVLLDGQPVDCETYLLPIEWLNRNYSVIPSGSWERGINHRKELA